MESPIAAPAAPAQPEPTTQPATHAAVVNQSTSEYRAARNAERAGKPLPAVPIAAEPDTPLAAAAPAPPQLSRKERDQQDANDRTRKAVEAATADLRAELDRVKASVAAPRSAPATAVADPPAPAAEKFPTLDIWAEKNPGKTFDDYLDARDDFRTEQATKAAKVDQEFKTRSEDLTKRGQAFSSAMGEAIKAEPDLADKIPPAMRDPQASIPLSAMSPEQLKTAKFSNLVAEAAFRSANGGSGKPAELLKYLHANQAEAVRIAGIAQQYGTFEALIALERIDERLAARATAAPTAQPKPKTLTSAPAQQETLGHRPAEATDPKDAAVRRGDTRAYREARREERRAERQR